MVEGSGNGHDDANSQEAADIRRLREAGEQTDDQLTSDAGTVRAFKFLQQGGQTVMSEAAIKILGLDKKNGTK